MNYAVYIAAALILGLLIALVALSIFWLQKRVLRNIRSKTMGLLSAYDELLEEKSHALAELKAPEPVPEERETPGMPEPAQENGNQMSAVVLSTIERVTASAYRQEEIGSFYQVIRQNFSYSLEDVLPELEKTDPHCQGPATALLGKLDYETVYQLSTLSREDQVAILRSVLEDRELTLLETYLAQNPEFSMLDFFDSLTATAAGEPGPAKLLVAQGTGPYQGPKTNVEIVADPEICEGFQIEQDNRLYDFSIKTRELS